MPYDPGAIDISGAFALIRSTFNVSPETLTEEKFAQLLNEALWLQEREIHNIESAILKVLAKVFT